MCITRILHHQNCHATAHHHTICLSYIRFTSLNPFPQTLIHPPCPSSESEHYLAVKKAERCLCKYKKGMKCARRRIGQYDKEGNDSLWVFEGGFGGCDWGSEVDGLRMRYEWEMEDLMHVGVDEGIIGLDGEMGDFEVDMEGLYGDWDERGGLEKVGEMDSTIEKDLNMDMEVVNGHGVEHGVKMTVGEKKHSKESVGVIELDMGFGLDGQGGECVSAEKGSSGNGKIKGEISLISAADWGY